MGHRSRRRFLTEAGLTAAASIVAPYVISPARAQSRVLRVNSYGGSWTTASDEAFYKPFTKATGIQVKPVTPVLFAKFRAQVQSGNYEFDVTNINMGEWTRADAQGLAEPIDWTVMKRDTLPPDGVAANGVTQVFQSTNLVYRTDKFLNGAPKSWADFWDVQKFPGPRALANRDPTRTISYALLADGVPHDKIYPMDLDRAFKKLDQIKPHIKVWWDGNNQSQQLLRDGEVYMESMHNARLTEMKREGLPVDIVWDGCYAVYGMWGVLKGSPNAKLAWEFIQFAVQPGPQAEFSKRLFYGPTQPKAFDLLPPDIVKEMPSYPANQALAVKQDPVWEGAHLTEVDERFTQWLAS